MLPKLYENICIVFVKILRHLMVNYIKCSNYSSYYLQTKNPKGIHVLANLILKGLESQLQLYIIDHVVMPNLKLLDKLVTFCI